ncbi:hypothetical protein KUTeg_013792 [Tegillarca granosa]|uniref:Uncharacterized protein n=1 Tax=Tegillarca granosa TaxID=220873 RepID=A0ABQ9EUQ3_TEGGR|nr:hypothetical protein KUTeg_013792 [Tegillarca granosa]
MTNNKCVQCALVGDDMVGKSCLVQAFTGEIVDNHYIATVFENYAGNVSVAGEKYTIGIFDSAGQHDFANLRAFTYRDSEVFILCFSVIDRESFNSIKSFWLPEIKQFMSRKKPIILVGTQSDTRESTTNRCVSYNEADELAKTIGAEGYYETSSITLDGVKDMFEKVALSALKYRKKKLKIIQRIFRDR